MAKRPVRIMARVQRSKNQGALKGATLFQPVTATSEFTTTVAREFTMMAAGCHREIVQAYINTGSPAIIDPSDGATMDAASLPTVMKRLLKKLRDRFERQFRILADNAVPRMIDRIDGDSSQRLRASLKDISEDLVINFDKTPQALKDVIAAGAQNASMYIKLVPTKYLDEVEGAVFRSISTGRGLADLVPALETQKVEKLRWAKNVAMDQTRKVYNSINKERMRSVGITKFEWVHSGGSNQPREYHKYTLNGNVYDIDDPPVIDQRTGERGYPGQLPYCRCTMRPVVDLNQYDDED